MVEKLARIAKHVMPGTAQVIVDENTNIDSATASWLNANYSKGGGSSEIKRNAIVIDSKLQTLKSGVNVSEVNSWSFDVLKYSNEQLFEVNQYMPFHQDTNPAILWLKILNHKYHRHLE